MAKEAPGDPKPLLKRQRMWKPNVRPSSPKLCVLAGDAMSGKIKRGSSTLLKTMLMMGGRDLDGNPAIKQRLGSRRVRGELRREEVWALNRLHSSNSTTPSMLSQEVTDQTTACKTWIFENRFDVQSPA